MSARVKPNVYLALRLRGEPLARIESECAVKVFEHTGMPSKQDLLAALRASEGLLGGAVLPVDREVLEAAPRLRVISNFGVGYDNVDLAVATKRGIVVCNTPGVLSDAVADLTIAMLLSLARRLSESERFVRDGAWVPGKSVGLGTDVRGKTLGIVGLGRIGKAVAERAQAFGMDVSYHDAARDAGEGIDGCRYRELDDLLRESDFVTLHVNLTDDTVGLIGARELELMKPTSYLINTARGPVVDQAALTAALRDGTIAGAALDVLEREPPPRDEPLLGMPNVLVLPHIGSATKETRAAMLDLAIDNLLTALRGETPRCAVNPEAVRTREPHT